MVGAAAEEESEIGIQGIKKIGIHGMPGFFPSASVAEQDNECRNGGDAHESQNSDLGKEPIRAA
jgi:hypothetical protein